MSDPISAYFDAINAEDWDALARLWEPEAELYPAGSRPRHGREAILAYYPRLLAGWTEHVDRPGRRITEADTVVEISFTGTTGQGRPVAFDAVDLQYAMVPTHQASFRGSFPALDEAAAAWGRGDRRAALRLVGDDTVHALCAIGGPETVAGYVRGLRAAGIDLPVVLTRARSPATWPGRGPPSLPWPRRWASGAAERYETLG